MSGSPSEQRVARLRRARDWLDARGCRSRVSLDMSPPVPRYQLTGVAGWVTGEQVIDHARTLGWAE